MGEAERTLRIALLGCGMMGREHISYLVGFERMFALKLAFICDTCEQSILKAQALLGDKFPSLIITKTECELLTHAHEIDLLIISTPNHLHTPSLIKWAKYDMAILVEKPVSVSYEQVSDLKTLVASGNISACIWVAMEYRYMPAISKLLSHIPLIGDVKMVTIRENRFPFLTKVGNWNRYRNLTGDTLVEKCCHFFDLFRLITKKEVKSPDGIHSFAQNGLNYRHEASSPSIRQPIIDSAYVTMQFDDDLSECDRTDSSLESASPTELDESRGRSKSTGTMGCLELCMFADGSRHQEEIVVTGIRGRLEAYLPENKVYFFERTEEMQSEVRDEPPSPSSIKSVVYDCSDIRDVHTFVTADFPMHEGYHYCSTSVEWFWLISTLKKFKAGERWTPHVSLDDGIRAVEMGLAATKSLGWDHGCET